MGLLRRVSITAACAPAAVAALLLGLCGGDPAPAAGAAQWALAGTLTGISAASFAGEGIAVGRNGDGVLAWETYPDLTTRAVATFSATAALTRVKLTSPLPAGASQLVALGGGHAAIGGLEGGPAGTFELQFIGPGGHSSAPVRPGGTQYLEWQPAVIAANRRGEIAVLGASGAQPVLTVCTAAAGCGRAVALAPSTGVLSVNGGQAPGTGLAVAIAADGTVIAAWVRNGMLETRWRTPDGRLGPRQRLSRVHSQAWLAAAVSASGRAALVWESQDYAGLARPGPATSPTIVAATTAPPGGRFLAAHVLARFAASRAKQGPRDVTLAGSPVVAAAFDGARPLVAWTGHGADGFTVRVADLDDLGAAEQTLSPPRTSAALGALVTAPGKGALAAWLACAYNSQRVCWPPQLQAAQAAPGQRFGAPATLGGPYESTFFSAGAVAAIDPTTGRPWVAATSGFSIYLFAGAAP